MSEMSNLSRYLAELEASLGHLNEKRRSEIIEEVRGHLEDRAHHFQLGGLPKEEAMSKAIENFGGAEEVGGEMRKVYKRGTWGEALLAAGATLLFTLLAESYRILWLAFRVRMGSLYALGAMGPVFLGVSAYAWRRDFPRWSYPWLGYALLWTLYASGERTLGPYVWPVALLLLGLLALSSRGFGPLITLARAIWRDWTLGSLALFPVTMFLSLLFLDEVYPSVEAPLYIGAGMVAALASIVFIKAQSSRARLGVLLMANAVIITPITYAAIFHTDYPMLLVLFPPEPAPLSVIVSMVLALGLTSTLLLGPPMALTFVNKAKQLAKR
jgi:hypothetical protein